MLYSCLLLWCCKCVIGTPQQKHLEIAYSPLVARDMILQQHAYKLCIVIDLVYNNQYWRMFHWPSSQGTLHMVKQKYNSSYGTSCTYRVFLWWFRTYSTLVQTSTATCSASYMVHAPAATSSKNEIWSYSQNFNIYTESQWKTNLYCIIFCSKLETSKEHVKETCQWNSKTFQWLFCLLWQIHSPWSRLLLWILIQLPIMNATSSHV
jgi:hypothetical protein